MRSALEVREATDGKRTASAVEQAVAGLDGVVDLVGAGVVVDLPEAKTLEKCQAGSSLQSVVLGMHTTRGMELPLLSLTDIADVGSLSPKLLKMGVVENCLCVGRAKRFAEERGTRGFCSVEE